MRKTKNLVGLRFGKLIVLKKSDYTLHNKTIWTCFCVCGNVVDVQAQLLLRGSAKSCGCLRHYPRTALVKNSTLNPDLVEYA